jgi:hypothetical protein
MSNKKQKPITAEEWSINGDGAESTYWLSVFFAGLGKSDKLADVFKIMEQYAQAKVSEALQSSKDIQDRFDDICIISHSLLEQIEDFENVEEFDFELEKIVIKSIIDNSSFEK